MDKDLAINLEEQSRRSFLLFSLFSSFLVLITGFTYTVLRFLWPTEGKGMKSQEGSLRIALEEVEAGSSHILRFRGNPVIIVRLKNNEVFALSATCTHLGCIVRWNEEKKQLICPCHAARFDLFGNVLGGPAPKPLPTFSAKVEDNKIVIG